MQRRKCYGVTLRNARMHLTGSYRVKKQRVNVIGINFGQSTGSVKENYVSSNITKISEGIEFTKLKEINIEPNETSL